jgi:hypothetical protein
MKTIVGSLIQEENDGRSMPPARANYCSDFSRNLRHDSHVRTIVHLNAAAVKLLSTLMLSLGLTRRET